MELAHLQSQQPQEDVHAMGLLLGLGEQHHVVSKGSHQESCREKSEPALGRLTTSCLWDSYAKAKSEKPAPKCSQHHRLRDTGGAG